MFFADPTVAAITAFVVCDPVVSALHLLLLQLVQLLLLLLQFLLFLPLFLFFLSLAVGTVQPYITSCSKTLIFSLPSPERLH